MSGKHFLLIWASWKAAGDIRQTFVFQKANILSSIYLTFYLGTFVLQFHNNSITDLETVLDFISICNIAKADYWK